MSALKRTNPLARGFYTVREAARLIEVGKVRRIHGWLRGYKGSRIGPLLVRDYRPIDGHEELSFHDLLEVRFVEFFRAEGVKSHTLRKALQTARDVFNTDKPLASLHVKFRSEGGRQDIFVEEVLKPAAKDADDPRLWSLLTKQYVHYEAIQQTLIQGVTFDPQTHLAKLWVPRPNFPDIIIDPRVAYGHPVTPSSVPTKTIRETWIAEEQNYGVVADWFQIAPAEVHMAIEFEECLDAEWRARAA